MKKQGKIALFFHYILNIALTIPLKHFGTFITTIFIKITPFYHLNKHRYPKHSRKIISITATIAIGRNAPAIIPRQNDRIESPAAFEHPFMQKLSIYPTSVAVLIYNMPQRHLCEELLKSCCRDNIFVV